MKKFVIWFIALAVLVFAHTPIAFILQVLIGLYQSLCRSLIASIF